MVKHDIRTEWFLQISRGRPIDPEPSTDDERREVEELKARDARHRKMATSDIILQWILQIGYGKPIDPQPCNDEQWQQFGKLKAWVLEMKAKGIAIDIPND
jgi:hypothetical protein